MMKYPLMETEPEIKDIQPFGEDKVSICRAYQLYHIKKYYPAVWDKLIEFIFCLRKEGFEVKSMELFSSDYEEDERLFNMWTLEKKEREGAK